MNRSGDGSNSSRQFWDQAARDDAMWHIATGASGNADEFFATGRRETDELLAHVGLVPDRSLTVLEIGCGIGRMTARLADRYGTVIALDVSAEMLVGARHWLAQRDNVRYVQGNGRDLAGIDSESVDVVFSYIVLQHVPTVQGQLQYLRETRRVLRPGGAAGIQIRSSTVQARLLDWAGHVFHRMQGRHTLAREWRGARLSRAAVLATASGYGDVDSPEGTGPMAAVELRPHGRRHTWVVLHRTP